MKPEESGRGHHKADSALLDEKFLNIQASYQPQIAAQTNTNGTSGDSSPMRPSLAYEVMPHIRENSTMLSFQTNELNTKTSLK